jgi:hypothetical protein
MAIQGTHENGFKRLLSDMDEGCIIKTVMEVLRELDKKMEKSILLGPVFTLVTVNSSCFAAFYAQISKIRAYPLKYTDPDGKTPKTALEMQIESAVKVIVFLYQNKDSIKKPEKVWQN